MDCERADLLVGLLGSGDADDDALTPTERAEAEAHVAACAACGEALDAYRALSGALRSLPAAADEAPSPEGTARAYAAVVEAMTAAGPRPAGVRVLEGGRAAPAKDERRAWRRPGVWLQGLAAAACLLIVVSLAVRTDDAPADQHARVFEPQAAPPEADAATRGAAERVESPPAAPAPAPARTLEAPPAPPAHDGLAQEEKGAAGADDDAQFGRDAGPAADPGPEGARLDDTRARGMEPPPGGGETAPAPPAQGPALPLESPPPAAPSAPSDVSAESARARGRPGGQRREADGAANAAEVADEADGALAATGGQPAEPVVVAAWQVDGRVVVLERAGDEVVARPGVLALADHEGGGAAPAGEPQGDGALAEPARSARVAPEVTLLPPSRVARADESRRDAVGARGLDRELRAILAAELGRSRDAGWSSRVAALLLALEQRVPPSATTDELAAQARRVLSQIASPEAAPATR